MTEISFAHNLHNEKAQQSKVLNGRVLAIDYGKRHVGVAISDESGTSVRPLAFLTRTNWKKLLRDVSDLLVSFDARTIVIGLPLRMDNSDSEMAAEVRRIARNFQLSLGVPVLLQDEKLTSRAATEMLNESKQPKTNEHSLAATIILRDYLDNFDQTSGVEL